MLLGAALAARFLASLLEVPEMLVLVAVGVLLGGSALDVVDVPLDSIGAQLLFTLGVSMILFYGGLNLSLPVLRRVWVALGLLVVPGVVLTAVVTGVAAYAVFDLPWTAALLLGAVLAPTDPAILIPLFVGSRLREKVAQTVVAESAFNDPTGAALALTFAGVLLSGGGGLMEPAADFVADLAISTVLGIVGGVLLAADDLEPAGRHLARVGRPGRAGRGRHQLLLARLGRRERLPGRVPGRPDRRQHGAPAAWRCTPSTRRTCAGSPPTSPTSRRCSCSSCWASNIPLGELADHLLPGLAVLAMLLFVARPLTVLACVLPDRGGGWTWPEIAFLCWTRETGVVPAALVGVIVGLGVPHGEIYASVVALAIVVTLVLQALPAPWLARRLGLLDGVRTAAGSDPLPTE